MENYNDYNDNNDNKKDYSYMYDRSDKDYENYCIEKSTEDLDGYCGDIQKFSNYEELLLLTQQEDTKDKINNIVFALMKIVIILKCKEVSFKFDFKFGSYDNGVDISDYFNCNCVGKDYRILIDEDSIVCILLNEKLIM